MDEYDDEYEDFEGDRRMYAFFASHIWLWFLLGFTVLVVSMIVAFVVISADPNIGDQTDYCTNSGNPCR